MIDSSTQTDENDFCLCFVPEYQCQRDETVMMDPRIVVKLGGMNNAEIDDVIFVNRSFEGKDVPQRRRWRGSGV